MYTKKVIEGMELKQALSFPQPIEVKTQHRQDIDNRISDAGGVLM